MSAANGGPTSPPVDLPAVVSTLAHDLRTPLATVYGFARTMQRQVPLDERGARFLGLILDAAADMERLIDHVAVVGRVAGGRFEAELEDVALSSLLASVGELVGPSDPDDRPIRVAVTTDAGTVRTDPSAAAEALVLLSEAALRLDPARPEARIEAVGGSILLDGFAPADVDVVLAGTRDLPLAAARSLLLALDTDVRARPDGVLDIRLPGYHPRDDDAEEGRR